MFTCSLVVTVGVPLLACVITTLAAVFPSRRAVRIDPVTALRHESLGGIEVAGKRDNSAPSALDR